MLTLASMSMIAYISILFPARPFLYVHLCLYRQVYYIWGLGINSWELFFLARFIDHEETWKYTNGTGWCKVLMDVWIMWILKKTSKLRYCPRCVYYLSEIMTHTSNLKKYQTCMYSQTFKVIPKVSTVCCQWCGRRRIPPASACVNFDISCSSWNKRKRKTWKGIMIRNVLTRKREYGTYLATAHRHRRRLKMQKRDE